MMRYVALFVVIIVLMYSLFVIVQTLVSVRVGRSNAASVIPFQQHVDNPIQHFLFIGDSTARGVGASKPQLSVAGLFGGDFPNAEIVNMGMNGERARGLLERFQPKESEQYDLIVIHCGGNDILRFGNLDQAAQDLSVVVDRAKAHSKQVVLLHTGDVGNVPFFYFPITTIMHYRTLHLRKNLMELAEEKGIYYIDLYTLEGQNSRSSTLDWFARDHLHPSDTAYEFWYKSIRNALGDSLK